MVDFREKRAVIYQRGLSANHSVKLITSRGADIKKLIIGATAQIKYLQGEIYD